MPISLDGSVCGIRRIPSDPCKVTCEQAHGDFAKSHLVHGSVLKVKV